MTEKKSWDSLDWQKQHEYVLEAEYLIKKGYTFGDPLKVAKRIYEGRSDK